LNHRERRALRLIEDAAIRQDPLLNLRLGSPLPLRERVWAAIRRKSTATWRRLTDHRGAPLVAGVAAVITLLFLALGSVVLAVAVLFFSASCMFALGFATAGSPCRAPPSRELTDTSDQRPT